MIADDSPLIEVSPSHFYNNSCEKKNEKGKFKLMIIFILARDFMRLKQILRRLKVKFCS